MNPWLRWLIKPRSLSFVLLGASFGMGPRAASASPLEVFVHVPPELRNAYEEKSALEQEMRAIVADVKAEILPHIQLTDSELKKHYPNAQQEYASVIGPRQKNMELHIASDALWLVDIQGNGQKELIFWSEGLYNESGLGKDFIAVAHKKGRQWRLANFRYLDPPPSVRPFHQGGHTGYRFAYRRFALKPLTANGFVGGVLTFASYGASGHTFGTVEVDYNPYDKVFDMRLLLSAVPLVPDTTWTPDT